MEASESPACAAESFAGPAERAGDSSFRRRALRTILVVLCVTFTLAAASYWFVGHRVRSAAGAMLRDAELALRKHDHAGARERLSWLLWFEPNEPRALLIAGVSLNADHRFPEAIALLERIPESSRTFEQAGIALCSSLISDGQFERAEAVLERLSERYPESRDIHDRRVRLYLQEYRQDDAVELLATRWQRYPADLSVLPDLLELSIRVNGAAARIRELAAANEKHPGQFPVLLGLARAHAKQGQVVIAQQQLNAALLLRPADADARLLATELALDQGDVPRAQELLQDVHADNDARYWGLRGRIADQTGDTQAALGFLEKTIALQPNRERDQQFLALLHRKLGDMEAAAAAAQRAVLFAEQRTRLLQFYTSFDHERPEPQLCRDIAECLQRMGETAQANGWRQLADSAERLTRTRGSGVSDDAAVETGSFR